MANGLFTVTLDFGATTFSGSKRWLQIGVRPGASTGAFTALSPRQGLTPAPNALFAATAATAQSLSATGGQFRLVASGGDVSVIGGWDGNAVSSGVKGGTISGGGTADFAGQTRPNLVTDD